MLKRILTASMACAFAGQAGAVDGDSMQLSHKTAAGQSMWIARTLSKAGEFRETICITQPGKKEECKTVDVQLPSGEAACIRDRIVPYVQSSQADLLKREVPEPSFERATWLPCSKK